MVSKNIDNQLTKSLQDLGLTDKEALVYTTLVQGRDVSAVQIAKATGLHRQFVYNALTALVEKGLVQKLGTATRALWRAETPRKLIARAEETERTAEQVANQLLTLMQQTARQEFSVTEGTRALRNRLIDTINRTRPDATILMICGQWHRYFERVGEATHAEWEKIRLKKGIGFRIIGPRGLHADMKDDSFTRPFTTYRVLPGLEENLVNTVIYPNHLDFEIYGDPHLTFSISDSAIVTSQTKFFEALWKKCDPL